MGNAQQLAQIVSELSGGHWGLQAERDAAEAIIKVWPKTPDMLRWHERFRSACAEDAVRRGIATVVFGEGGWPLGDAPHLAAAGASVTASFLYAEGSVVVAGQRGLSLRGDDRAKALTASIRDPAGLLGAIKEAGGDGGPMQLQWGLAAMLMGRAEAAALAAEYARLLPPGSELVIAVPDGDEGRQFARIIGAHPHTARNVAAWCVKAGLKLDGPVSDVRAWGRSALGGELRGTGGRIMAVVARVP